MTSTDTRATGYTIKPLVWDKHPDNDEWYGGGQENLVGMNEYDIFPHPAACGFVLDVMGNRSDEDYSSPEAAKAAAQADYDTRITAAITPAQDTREAALREAAGLFFEEAEHDEGGILYSQLVGVPISNAKELQKSADRARENAARILALIEAGES